MVNLPLLSFSRKTSGGGPLRGRAIPFFAKGCKVSPFLPKRFRLAYGNWKCGKRQTYFD
jgi:hypothetical protein